MFSTELTWHELLKEHSQSTSIVLTSTNLGPQSDRMVYFSFQLTACTSFCQVSIRNPFVAFVVLLEVATFIRASYRRVS